ncbi:Uncharacterised protein [Legionella quateirensis]|uniref:Uncharacterized protein n=1 Tax=Legionella quateirensis TaxID=45072 RepID=A0A378KSA3_9GAMM|nr:hypothetical protein Lqua_1527 [Legionella quateirensis]STY17453.1 Uncharacterised protein [Legionella quateirensis]
MILITRIKWILFIFLFILLGQKDLNACQCFNAYFLNSVFYTSAEVNCYISRDHGVIVNARISDGRNNAGSFFYGCSLNSVNSNINREYFDLYSNDNELCIDEIMQACMMLRAELYSE